MKSAGRIWLYQLLVNRVPGIYKRYHEMRKTYGGKKGQLLGWCALLFWNIRYYALGGRDDSGLSGKTYEKKKLKLQESACPGRMDRRELRQKMKAADVISFDVFDTLLVRPFSEPADLFYLVGMYFSCPDFRLLRMEAEQKARRRKRKYKEGEEVTLAEIWERLEKMTGIPAEKGMAKEREMERKYCFANPCFSGVPQKLREDGKTVIAVSDMYLEREFLESLLAEKGFGGLDACFVSSQWGATKAEGTMYAKVEAELAGKKRFLHIGDDRHSDIAMAKRAGWDAFWYPNIQAQGRRYRSRDMSAITGSMYGGMVNIRLHNGSRIYSPFYEYGYVYGGILALGYCQFIHDFVRRKEISQIWFLARDGEVLKKIYDCLYPEEETVYVLWSRGAAARLLSSAWKEDFFERFLFQKTGQGYTMAEIFRAMDLEHMLLEVCKDLGCRTDTRLDLPLAKRCRSCLKRRWRQVETAYREEKEAAGEYLTSLAGNHSRIATVDIGWAGSGALGISHLLREEFGLSCKVYGILAGTNTCHNPRPDTSESYFFDETIVSYLFSQAENRDLWKFHDLNQKHNLYMELLFTSASPTLKGFFRDENGKVGFRYGRKEAHGKEIQKVQRGISDFITDYRKYFPAFVTGERGSIKGRDAYAPLLLFLQDKKVRKGLERLFDWDTSENAQ